MSSRIVTKNPADRNEAKRRGRNREEAERLILMIPDFFAVSSIRRKFFLGFAPADPRLLLSARLPYNGFSQF
jgi:hypothetical protein